MKKVLVSVLLILALLMAVSCKTSPATDETFGKIYDKYIDRLILDGAAEYTVKGGDSLSKISQTFYNDQFYYPVIMLASRNVVLDPDKIQPGMVLIIPDLQKNLQDTRAKAAIKGVITDCIPIEKERRGDSSAGRMRDLARSL